MSDCRIRAYLAVVQGYTSLRPCPMLPASISLYTNSLEAFVHFHLKHNNAINRNHHTYRTEQAYIGWAKHCIQFHACYPNAPCLPSASISSLVNPNSPSTSTVC